MTDAEFLGFKDWLASKEHLRNDWIVVGRLEKFGGPESKTTFSAVTTAEEELLLKIVSHPDWDVSMDLGRPRFQMLDEGTVALDIGTLESSLGARFEAFTLYRDFHGAYESTFDLAQDFVLYHNLYHDTDEAKLVDPLSDEEVVRYPDAHTVLVKSIHLREYLAARKRVLVRFHDHRRFVKKSVESVLGKKHEETIVKTNDSYYQIYAGALDSLNETFSRLLGKDLIRPFSEPKHEDYLFLMGKRTRD